MTIVAISTAAGAAGGIGVVRMSGAESLRIARQLFTVKGNRPCLQPNMMTLGTIDCGAVKEKAFCVYFAAPLSFTGEDVVEFHCHGGTAILQSVVSACVREGARPATKGEFSRRAFLNGKMTLDECEGVIDMIEAEGTADLNQAYRLMSGEVGQKIQAVTDILLDAASDLEAALDYPEEVLDDMRVEAKPLLEEAQRQLAAMLADGARRRIIKEGATVALAGSPNVGKSSILNAILDEQRAIVSDIPGTTRDTLTESIEYKGVRLNIVDTAGLRETADIIESEGVRRAKTAVKGADITVLVADSADFECEKFVAQRAEISGKCLTVGNKADKGARCEYPFDLTISAKTGDGVVALLDRIIKELDVERVTDTAIVMRDRHLAAIRQAKADVDDAVAKFDTTTGDCLLVDIEGAVAALYAILGKDVSADVVDKVFSRFCVGK